MSRFKEIYGSLVTVNGTVTTATWETDYGQTVILLFSSVTGLTGTISVSTDDTNFVNCACEDNSGNSYLAGETITIGNTTALIIPLKGATKVKFTRVAGSGSIKPLLTNLFYSVGGSSSSAGANLPSPALNIYCMVGYGGTSTVVGEVIDANGKTVDVNVSLAVTTTAKSWEAWYEASAGTPTYVSTMKAFRVLSVSGAPLLINTAGNGDPSTNNGVTSGLEPAYGQAFQLAIGDYTQDNIGFGLGF